MEIVQTGEASPAIVMTVALANLWNHWEGRVYDRLPLYLHTTTTGVYLTYRLLEDVQRATGWTSGFTDAAFRKVVADDYGRGWCGGYEGDDSPMVTKRGFLETLRLSGLPLNRWWAYFYKSQGFGQAPDRNLQVWRAVTYTINGGELNTNELRKFSHEMRDVKRWAYTLNKGPHIGEYFFCKGLAEKAKALMVNQEWHSPTGELVWPRQCPGSAPVVIDMAQGFGSPHGQL